MKPTIFKGILVALAVFVLTASSANALTIYTGPDAGNNDTWNVVANWDNGIPSGTTNVVIDTSKFAGAKSSTTPTYTGTLTLNNNSTLKVWSDPADKNAYGTGAITMNDGSRIIMRHGAHTFSNAITLTGNALMATGESTTGHHTTKTFSSAISGAYGFTIEGVNNNTINLDALNTFSSFTADRNFGSNYRVYGNLAGSLGTGDVTFNDTSTLVVNAANVIADTGVLSLNGARDAKLNASYDKLHMNFNDTVSELWIDGVQAYSGTYDNTQSWLSGGGILTVSNGAANVAPILTDTYDEFFETVGGPNENFDQIWQDFTSVNYTVTFDKDMDAATLDAADFGNAGTTTGWSIGAITKTVTPPVPNAPSEFNVEVQLANPTAGTLQLQVNPGADLKDTGGTSLDTTSAILDDTTITITSGNTPTATITGTTGGGDSWNQAGNWDQSFVPFGPGDAIIASGVTAQVDSLPPSYDGTLTLNSGSTLQFNWNNNDATVFNALGTGITMNDGSTINTRTQADPHFPAITLAGDASFTNTANWADHDPRYFDGAISGPGSMTVVGRNNNTYELNAASPDWSGGFIANAIGSWRVEANASGAFGTGDVTINGHATNPDQGATLIINAQDVIADTAMLSLNDGRDHRKSAKLILNANDTILGFTLDGVSMAPGTYDNSSGLTTPDGDAAIGGTGTLTVSGIAATDSSGTWDMDWSAVPYELSVDKTATDLDPFDIEITVAGGGTTRDILENVLNSTDTDWTQYQMQLGFGLGPDFVLSESSDGLGFSSASSVAFSDLLLTEDELAFDDGNVSIGAAADFALEIGIPTDDPYTFTLRQLPSSAQKIPEPSTFVLAALGLLGLGWYSHRRRNRIA